MEFIGSRNAVTVGELKRLLQDVPDDFLCTIELEGVNVTSVEVNRKEKTVDFGY
jgi:hypothetical protein